MNVGGVSTTRVGARSLASLIVLIILSGLLLPATARRASASRVADASPSALKPPLQGLVDRTGFPRSRKLIPQVAGFVVDVPWADLQPEAGGPISPHNPIDKAISQIRALPTSQRHALRIRLRVRGGVEAPDWAKRLGGEPIQVVARGAQGTIGRFWLRSYGQAYDTLQRDLAKRYDDVPEIAEVVISRCTTFFAEPMLRQWGDEKTQAALLANGYTAEADEDCQHEEIDAQSVWRRTRSDLALNPYQRIGPDGNVTADLPFTVKIASYCRKQLGSRCVLANYSIRWPLQPSPYPEMYAAISRAGPPIAFQTAAQSRIGDWQQALEWAASKGANSVELNRSYPRYDPATLRAVTEDLRANAT
jgi:hypothetical protein